MHICLQLFPFMYFYIRREYRESSLSVINLSSVDLAPCMIVGTEVHLIRAVFNRAAGNKILSIKLSR